MNLEILVAVLLAAVVFAILVARHYYDLYQAERRAKASAATKHGLTFEQLLPFAKEFPGDPRLFRFIGDPIDGVLFGENEITFVEFKTGRSRVNHKQTKIRKLVEEGRVRWKEIRS